MKNCRLAILLILHCSSLIERKVVELEGVETQIQTTIIQINIKRNCKGNRIGYLTRIIFQTVSKQFISQNLILDNFYPTLNNCISVFYIEVFLLFSKKSKNYMFLYPDIKETFVHLQKLK